MTRELRRLLIEPERLRSAGGQEPFLLPLHEPEIHYLRRVLRLGSGDPLAVIDGAGQLWTAELSVDRSLLLHQPLAEPLQSESAARPSIALAMAVPKRDTELVWRMATELGVDRLQPLIAEHSQDRQGWPLQRWASIVEEACEQCERLWLPELQPPSSAMELLSAPPDGLGLLATTREPGLPLLEEVLASSAARAAAETLSLAIGPEGGWSPRERDGAQSAGWLAVSLGPTILRTATAAITATSRLTSWRTLSCASSP